MITRQLTRSTPLMLLMIIGILGLLLLDSQPLRSAHAQDADLDYDEHIAKGNRFLRQRDYEEALKSFKRANELRSKKSAEAYNLMSEAYFGLGAFKNVVESADKVIEFANGDKLLLTRAYNNKGLALHAAAERKDQKKLQAAEAAFRQALALEGMLKVAHYNLGMTLLQLNRDEEGVAEIKKYIEAQPDGAYADSA